MKEWSRGEGVEQEPQAPLPSFDTSLCFLTTKLVLFPKTFIKTLVTATVENTEVAVWQGLGP